LSAHARLSIRMRWKPGCSTKQTVAGEIRNWRQPGAVTLCVLERPSRVVVKRSTYPREVVCLRYP
jgi:hypothetical protein